MPDRLSPDGLARLHDAMTAHVESGRMPGLVYLVAAGDEVHVEAVGQPAFDASRCLRTDDLFRVASLTKPITAVATMSLVEDGALRLDQSIDDLIPELADRQVLRRPDAELDDTLLAERAITVEDLLTFRAGMGSPMVEPGSTPLMRAEADLDLRSIGGPPWPPTHHDVDTWIAALGTLPWLAPPGERWLYNTSAQILGVLLTRATGKPLETVFRERVFTPCAMIDTSFTVAATKLDRFTTAYGADPVTGELRTNDEPSNSWWSTEPSFPDASGMLVSTVEDYWRFVSTFLAGELVRPGTVRAMTTDQLTAAQREGAPPFLGGPDSWGLGLVVPSATAEGAAAPLPTGVGWDGGSGCTWRTSLRTGVTGILLTQREMDSPEPPAVFQDFWTGVNALP